MLGVGLIGNVLGGVLNLASTHLESKAAIKKAKAEAEAEVLKTAAAHESKWEMAMANASDDSSLDQM